MRIHHLVLLVVALLCTSCSRNVTQLDGALGAIPIFSPATFKERHTAHTSDDIGDPTKFSTYTWYLETATLEFHHAAVTTGIRASVPGAGRGARAGARNPQRHWCLRNE